MLTHPEYAWSGDDADLARLVEAHPWVTMVSRAPTGLVVSHLPVLVDRAAGELSLLSHLGSTDAEQHALGTVETVLVVQGPHGYVSAGWYVGGPYVSTWNYVVAHLHGRPERLGPEETFDVLSRTQQHFEAPRAVPHRLDRQYARRIAPHVAGFRLVPSRIDVKAKLSQDKPAEDLAGVLRGLEDPMDVHADPALAAAMRTGGVPR